MVNKHTSQRHTSIIHFNLQRVALTLSLLHTAHDNTIKHLATYKVVQHLVWLPALAHTVSIYGLFRSEKGCVHKMSSMEYCCTNAVWGVFVNFSFLSRHFFSLFFSAPVLTPRKSFSPKKKKKKTFLLFENKKTNIHKKKENKLEKITAVG